MAKKMKQEYDINLAEKIAEVNKKWKAKEKTQEALNKLLADKVNNEQ